MERNFEGDIKATIFGLGRDRAPSPKILLRDFWLDIKDDIMDFLAEFHKDVFYLRNCGPPSLP